mgnify:CR=1 FL=1
MGVTARLDNFPRRHTWLGFPVAMVYIHRHTQPNSTDQPRTEVQIQAGTVTTIPSGPPTRAAPDGPAGPTALITRPRPTTRATNGSKPGGPRPPPRSSFYAGQPVVPIALDPRTRIYTIRRQQGLTRGRAGSPTAIKY